MGSSAIECLVLSFLSVAKEPEGAGAIRDCPKEQGFQLGEATVGRILKQLDNQGLVERVGFQGRVLSEKGQDYLANLLSMREKKESLRNFGQFLFTDEGTHVRDILVARRALESEAAALAADNATEEDLESMERALREMESLLASNQSMAVTDVKFHEAISRASKNRIIETALRVIRHGGQDSSIVEKLRNTAGSVIGKDHKEIFEAIKGRDGKKARTAMTRHLNSILDDLEYVEKSMKI